MERKYTVYIRTEGNGLIAEISSDAFLADTAGWIAIDSGNGDRYHHAQSNYLPKVLHDRRGVCRYKLLDGEIVERSAEEMEADAAARPTAEPNNTELLMEIAADHEYRLCLMEMGVAGN